MMMLCLRTVVPMAGCASCLILIWSDLHVAVPVAELLPDSVHPVTGQSLAELAETLLAAAAQAGEPFAQARGI